MGVLRAKLLGVPRVWYGGVEASFSLRKTAGLLYYLLEQRAAARDALAELLWPGVGDSIARKNLRNAVYNLNKTLGDEVVVRAQHQLIIAPGIRLDLDLDRLADGDVQEIAWEGFLQGFSLPALADYQLWAAERQEHYRQMYLERRKAAARRLLDTGLWDEAEQTALSLLELDALDEDIYEILLGVYIAQEKRSKGIALYRRLEQRLEDAYGVAPSPASARLLEQFTEEKRATARTADLFFGRDRELAALHRQYTGFLSGAGPSVAVLGEAGIGKTKLVRRLVATINPLEAEILATGCYQAEERFFLRPWSQIFSDLGQLLEELHLPVSPRCRELMGTVFPGFARELQANPNPPETIGSLGYQAVEQAAIEVLLATARAKPLVIVLEDLQWMDDMSLSLLRSMLLADQNSSVWVVATCRTGHEEGVRQLLAELSGRGLMRQLPLARLSRRQVAEFARLALPARLLTAQVQDNLYRETEGNLFFLVEYIKGVETGGPAEKFSPKMRDVLESRILGVSPQGRELLGILSIFFDRASLSDLQSLGRFSEPELVGLVEELLTEGLVEEQWAQQDCTVSFTHQKLREYVYDRLSLARRKMLHSCCAALLEGKLRGAPADIDLYSRLIYHFTEMGNLLGALRYTLKNLGEYFHFNHEVFPVISDVALARERYLYLNNQQAQDQLEAVAALVQRLESSGERGDDFIRLKLTFYHMFGRFYLRGGDYENGVRMIRVVIEEALRIGDYNLAYDGYRQMFCFCINTLNIADMRLYIEQSYRIVDKCSDPGKVAILDRLNGYLKMMEGDFAGSEREIRKSIVEFQKLDPQRYVVNVAAAYYFLGENRRRQRQFDKALEYYRKGAALCESSAWTKGLGVLYAGAAQAAYELGSLDEAAEHAGRSISIYSVQETIWGKGIAYTVMCLLLADAGRYREALEHLQEAESSAHSLRSPYELGLVHATKAELCWRMDQDPAARDIWSTGLDGTLDSFCRKALEYFSGLAGCYEVDRLHFLMI